MYLVARNLGGGGGGGGGGGFTTKFILKFALLFHTIWHLNRKTFEMIATSYQGLL